MSIPSFQRAFHTLACASFAALLLASCGGGGGGGSTAGSEMTGTASTAQSADTTSLASGGASGGTAKAGGAASSKPATPSTPSTPSVPATVTTAQIIDYYGDSTVWGYGSGTGARVATPAPAAFAAALPAAAGHQVRNEGVSGSTACDLLNGADGRHPAWDAQLSASNATVVILNHAINDQWRMDVATYKSCLSSLARKAKAHGKKVVFETPNPTRDSGADSLDVYVDAMRAVAAQEGAPVIDQYRYLTSYLNGQSPYTICFDGLHPNDATYIMKGKYAAGVFTTLAL